MSLDSGILGRADLWTGVCLKQVEKVWASEIAIVSCEAMSSNLGTFEELLGGWFVHIYGVVLMGSQTTFSVFASAVCCLLLRYVVYRFANTRSLEGLLLVVSGTILHFHLFRCFYAVAPASPSEPEPAPGIVDFISWVT